MQIRPEMDVTQGHCSPEKGQGLPLRMGKGLGTPMHPSESVFLGHSAHLWLMSAIECYFDVRPKAMNAMPCNDVCFNVCLNVMMHDENKTCGLNAQQRCQCSELSTRA